VEMMPRDAAEKRYGHRLYQGGAVPGKVIRVVDIPGIDAEACGGIHCARTSLVGPIRIKRTRRIQDGVVRIEYMAGTAAVEDMQADRDVVESLATGMSSTREGLVEGVHALMADSKELRKRLDRLLSERTSVMAKELLSNAVEIGDVRLVRHLDEEGMDIAAISKELSKENGLIVVLGQKDSGRVLVSVSKDAGIDARGLLKSICAICGGGGGGKPDFAQGGGADPSRMSEGFDGAVDIVREALQE